MRQFQMTQTCVVCGRSREDAYTDADHLTDADIDLMAQTVAAGISSAAKM